MLVLSHVSQLDCVQNAGDNFNKAVNRKRACILCPMTVLFVVQVQQNKALPWGIRVNVHLRYELVTLLTWNKRHFISELKRRSIAVWCILESERCRSRGWIFVVCRAREYGPLNKTATISKRKCITLKRNRSTRCSSCHATAIEPLRTRCTRQIGTFYKREHEQCKLKSIFVVARKRLISFYNTNCKLCAIYWEFLLYRLRFSFFALLTFFLCLFYCAPHYRDRSTCGQGKEKYTPHESAHATHMIPKWENILSRFSLRHKKVLNWLPHAFGSEWLMALFSLSLSHFHDLLCAQTCAVHWAISCDSKISLQWPEHKEGMWRNDNN